MSRPERALNSSNLGGSHLTAIGAATVFSVLISLQSTAKPNFPIEDAFHFGEFLAPAITILRNAPFHGPPYTIHGAADFLPALIVSLFISSPDMLLANTVVLYPFLTMASVLFTVLAAVRLSLRFATDPLVIIPFILISGLCIDWRDLFFSLSLYIFAHLVPDERGEGSGPATQLLFGFVIALGTYWSFNRGIAAVVAFGPLTVWLAIQQSQFLLSVASAIAVFITLDLLVPGLSVVGYFQNLIILLQTSSQWSYPSTLTREIWAALIISLTTASITLAMFKIYRRSLSIQCVVLAVPLILSSVVYTKIGLGRIDQSHIVMSAWLPLLLASLLMRTPELKMSSWRTLGLVITFAMIFTYFARGHAGVWPMFATGILTSAGIFGPRVTRYLGPALLMLSVSILMLMTGRLYVQVRDGDYEWLRNISTLPPAVQSVSPGILWSASALHNSGAKCVFDLVNTGLINAISNLPACSRFTYPVYAGPQHESALIKDLVQSAPPAIIYRGDFWSYAIDGRPMSTRFPSLNFEILRRYPREECNHGYCLRFLK